MEEISFRGVKSDETIYIKKKSLYRGSHTKDILVTFNLLQEYKLHNMKYKCIIQIHLKIMGSI